MIDLKETSADLEYNFPLWVGENRDSKSNVIMSCIHDIWSNRDELGLVQITDAFNTIDKTFKQGIFDVKTSKADKLIVHTCEFRHFSFCNWNELMVMKDNLSNYCYTPMRLRLRMILSEATHDWVSALDGNGGFFYITGHGDVSDEGKLAAFGVEGLSYKTYCATPTGPVGYEQSLMKNGAKG